MALLYEKEDKVVTITLNRPDAMNSFDLEQLTEFHEALVKYQDDNDAWVAIITGAGDKAFSAGADLKKLVPALLEGGLVVPPNIMKGMDIYKPFIAAVNGLAFGGGMELVLACDIRIAAEHATFGLPEVRWSIMPGWGGTQRLPRMVPSAMAAQLLLVGDSISAQEAYRIGLVNEVVGAAELLATARRWADRIVQNGPLAVWASKQAMNKGINMTLDEGLKLEDLILEGLTATEDAKEGPRAFVDKRKPEFKLR